MSPTFHVLIIARMYEQDQAVDTILDKGNLLEA